MRYTVFIYKRTYYYIIIFVLILWIPRRNVIENIKTIQHYIVDFIILIFFLFQLYSRIYTNILKLHCVSCCITVARGVFSRQSFLYPNKYHVYFKVEKTLNENVKMVFLKITLKIIFQKLRWSFSRYWIPLYYILRGISVYLFEYSH